MVNRTEDEIEQGTFPSLRLGFAAVLLAAGIVPLIAALSVAWHLAGRDAARQAERQAAIAHGLMVRTVELTVDRLADTADRLAGEPAVRALAEAGDAGTGAALAMEEERQQVMRQLFAKALSAGLPVRGVCFASAASGLAVCSDPSALHASGSAAGGATRLETHEAAEGETFIRFVKPLSDEGAPGAALVFLLDERAFLNPGRLTALRSHVLKDEAGRHMAGTGNMAPAGAAAGEGAAVASSLPVSVLAEQWTSVTQWDPPKPDVWSGPIAAAAFWSGLLVLALAAGAAVLFRFTVSRPLLALRKLMKRAESGDLKAYWTMRAAGEIGRLGDSYNQMLNRLDELIKQVKVEEALKKEKEIEALHYQLNPHFLYNTLNTIKWVAKIHRTPQIADAVSALVRLLQASLGKKGDFLPLREEIELVRDYMAIQSFRYGDEIGLVTDIEAVTALCLVPKLLLQPLVENAVIHGLQRKEGEKTITIRSWLERDLLFLQVEDNGVGMEAGREPGEKRLDAMERMSGIGLRHIREKLKLYYGPDYPMRIFSKPGEGTRIRLALPIHRSDEA